MADQENNTPTESAEDLAAEKDNQVIPKEDELRATIISEYGFNEETDKERIDKAVKRETDQRTKLSKAISQKRTYREQVDNFKKATPPKVDAPKAEDVSKLVNDELDKRELSAMPYPDDIKKVIQSVAKINGTSHREAVNDPYVAAKIEAWNKTQDSDEAAIRRTNNQGGKVDNDPYLPPDVDLGTKKGRDEYDAWKEKAIKKEKAQWR